MNDRVSAHFLNCTLCLILLCGVPAQGNLVLSDERIIETSYCDSPFNNTQFNYLWVTDVDSDGSHDVISSHSSGRQLMWFKNDGSADFVSQTDLRCAGYYGGYYRCASGDIDADGLLDFCVYEGLGSGYASFKVLHNNGEGDFETISLAGGASFSRTSIEIVDVDNDGHQDVLSMETYGSNKVIWHKGDGCGGFVTHVSITGLLYHFSADLNGDALPDLVGTTGWHENLGAGTFDPTLNVIDIDSGGFQLALDADGDGDSDIAANNKWYENNGTGVFSNTHAASFNSLLLAVDLDSDGDVDVLGKTAWYENDASGQFTAHAIKWLSDPYLEITDINVFDIDNDGDLDVFVSGDFSVFGVSQIALRENLSNGIGNTYHWPRIGQLDGGEELWINTDVIHPEFGISGTVHFSTNAGTSWVTADMSESTPINGYEHWYANIGSFAAGTVVYYWVEVTDGVTTLAHGSSNNYKVARYNGLHGIGNLSTQPWSLSDYVTFLDIEACPQYALVKVSNLAGDITFDLQRSLDLLTWEHIESVTPPVNRYYWTHTDWAPLPKRGFYRLTYEVEGLQEVTVVTETANTDAAEEVVLNYTLDDWQSTAGSEIPLEKIGSTAAHDVWETAIGPFESGTTLKYFLKATEATGNVIYDNNNGQDYEIPIP